MGGVVLVNVHALLSLDRFFVEPLSARRFELLCVYVAFILLPAVAGIVLPLVIDHKKHAKWMQGPHPSKDSQKLCVCVCVCVCVLCVCKHAKWIQGTHSQKILKSSRYCNIS